MIVLIGILSFLVLTCQADESTRGFPITSLSPRVLLARADTTCNNIYGPVCGDCNTLWTCLGVETPYKTQTCDKSYPGQPYCVDGACSSSPDPNDDQCSTSGVTCTGTGYFPNPLNCSQYFFCKGPKGESMSYECPNGFVYNSLTKVCKRRLLLSDCGTINCASNPDKYVAYMPDPSYYALCMVSEGSATPIVFRCPDSQQFVPSERRCKFQCKQEGRVADGKDCSKYYECYRNGLTYITLHQKCLTGFIFNSEANGCVEGTCGSDQETETGVVTGETEQIVD